MSKKLIFAMSLLVLLLVSLSAAGAQDMMSMTAECGADTNTSNFQSIEAVDALTVRFTLCAPDPAFPSKVAFSAFGIQPSEHIEATGGGGDLLRNPIGTGPYRLDTWDLGNEIVFTRNDSYWGDPAREATLIFRWNSEAASRFVELQSGTVDGIDNPAPGDFEVIAGDANLALYPRGGTNVFYLGMNNRIEPFTDVRVRQAVAYAIDRQRIVDNFYPPGSEAATQFMPPVLFGNTPEVAPFPYDPAMARQLIEEAAAENGWTLPLEVTLNYRDVVRGYLPQPLIVGQDIQAQLAEVGININIEVLESGAFLQAAAAGELAMFMLGWGADYPDPTNFLDFHFGNGAAPRFGDLIPELGAVLAQAAQLADPDARYPLYVEANTILRDQAPMIPIAHGGSGVAFQARITGAHSSPLGNEQFAVMEDPDDDNIIWMQNGEPISLYCADETDGETLRACEQIVESLLAYEVGGTAVVPALAASFEPNEDLTVWTFTLREGVTFHDGSALDANDVVVSFGVQWDAASPLHVGNSGVFEYFSGFFGGFLNPPPAEGG
ncbi:MAG: peptide ABC transporter substrate-binding protein [Chloroflexi bacterium]|nr:peptide ABC transporter substrate-binding protein [Chloroflexota bacterium]